MTATSATDPRSFELMAERHRAELTAHCYRMLGSSADAEDAVQETLLRAWRALPRFEGRSSLRAWLYRIATNVCLRAIERRPKRVLPVDYGPPSDPHDPPAEPPAEPVWLDPYADEALAAGRASPDARYEQRESVELAFVAALQHLPERQRAVLLLRDVLGFAPAEIATLVDATPAAIYSALQRAHRAVDERLPVLSQQQTLRSIGDERLRDVVQRYVDAWDEADVEALVALLTEDASFAMPPRPAWFRGRTAIGAFLAAHPLSRPWRWRRVPIRANGQPAFGVYRSSGRGTGFEAHAIEVLSFDPSGEIAAVIAFHRPEAFARFGLAGAMD
jgi:RNA polymerase sigma-70 factor (ECF subfamily)